MTSRAASMKSFVKTTPAGRRLLDLYHRIRFRDYWLDEQRRRELYRPYVRPGDLVFDIGANAGRVTETFMALGAQVVAVEPNPELVSGLRRLPRRRVRVE